MLAVTRDAASAPRAPPKLAFFMWSWSVRIEVVGRNERGGCRALPRLVGTLRFDNNNNNNNTSPSHWRCRHGAALKPPPDRVVTATSMQQQQQQQPGSLPRRLRGTRESEPSASPAPQRLRPARIPIQTPTMPRTPFSK
ncbi:unnamed protein product [Lampetra fluviatilis]